MRFRRSIMLRILIGLLVPSFLLTLLGFLYFRTMERTRMSAASLERMSQSERTCRELVELRRTSFGERALRLASDNQLIAPYALGDDRPLKRHLELLRTRNDLEGIAILAPDGDVTASAGLAPAAWGGDLAAGVTAALEREPRVLFTIGRDGSTGLTAMSSLFSANRVSGILLVRQRLVIDESYPAAVLVSRGEVLSGNRGAEFVLPYVSRVDARDQAHRFSFAEEAVTLAKVPVPGLDPRDTYILVGVDHRELHGEGERLITRTAILCVAVLAVLVVYAFLLTRALTLPLRRLVRVSEKLPGDGHPVTWPPARNDEIGVLTNAMRTMTNAFQRSESRLRVTKEGLESRVRQRTADLRRINDNLKHEVCEREMIQDELVRAKELAESANRAKTEFLANMSHEIRTPINGIMGTTELMLDTALTREQREYTMMVSGSVHALLDVINDILDFSRIEAGKMPVRRTSFHLRRTLADVVGLLAVTSFEKGIEISSHVRPDVPEIIEQDASRLRQILLNLLGNAIKFTKRGEVALSVDVESRTEEEIKLHFRVRDTGIGIPEDRQSVVFEPFEQADGSATREYGGTGLGLAIASTLAGMMGGDIWLESKEGEGSTFHVVLPTHRPVTSEADPAAETCEALRGRRALVVDRGATNRMILVDLFEAMGVEAVAVVGMDAALEHLEAARDADAPFDLIVVDTCHPSEEGLALAAAIRDDPDLDGAVVVMVAPHSRAQAETIRRDLGAAGALVKPVFETTLRDVVRLALGVEEEVGSEVTGLGSDSSSLVHGLRILLVEDNRINQKVAARMLERRGYEVTTAGNGRIALEVLECESFDVILMDVQMPEMGGEEATRRIRAAEQGTGRHVPIIAMTARAMKGDRDRCLTVGMDDYVSKPVRPEVLMTAIEGIVRPGRDDDAPGTDEVAADGPDPKVFDRTGALDRLDDDEELLAELVEVFLEDWPDRVEALSRAIDTGDLEVVTEIAHAVKGGATSLGAGAGSSVAAELEELARFGDAAAVRRGFVALEREMERLVTTLKGFLARGIASGFAGAPTGERDAAEGNVAGDEA